jgi:exosortase/archaeosortase family protein
MLQINRRSWDGAKIRDRHVMLAFAGCVAFSTLWQRIVVGGIGTGSFDRIFDVGAAEAVALFALCLLATQMKNDTLLSRVDLLIITVLSLAFVLPSLKSASLAMLAVALMFVARRDARLTSIGQLLLALVSYHHIGRLIFDFFAPYVLPLETIAVSTILMPLGNFSRDGVLISGPNGHTIYVEAGCSAFHNITIAVLIWLALIKLERLQFLRSDWLVLATMIGTTIILNTIRIALMAQSPTMLEYWHDGAGVAIVSVTMLAAMLAISLLSRIRPAAMTA